MSKIKIIDILGDEITYSYTEYVKKFPEPTAEYGHRDYYEIFDAKYSKNPEVYNPTVQELIEASVLDLFNFEEDAEGVFSFEWNTNAEREEIFNNLQSLL